MATPPDGPGRHGRWRALLRSRYGLLAASGAAVALLLVVFQFGLQGAARRLGVVPRPEHFTELFFTSSTRLPDLAAGRPLRLSFVIDNREGTAWTYHWSVVARGAAFDSILARGSVELAPSRASHTIVDVPAARLAGSRRVEVRLAHPDEAIDLHLAQSPVAASPGPRGAAGASGGGRR